MPSSLRESLIRILEMSAEMPVTAEKTGEYDSSVDVGAATVLVCHAPVNDSRMAPGHHAPPQPPPLYIPTDERFSARSRGVGPSIREASQTRSFAKLFFGTHVP